MRKLIAVAGAAMMVACGTLLAIDEEAKPSPVGSPDAANKDGEVATDTGNDSAAVDAGDAGKPGCQVVVADGFTVGAALDTTKWDRTVDPNCVNAILSTNMGWARFKCESGANTYNRITSKNTATPAGHRIDVDFSFNIQAGVGGDHIFAIVLNGLGYLHGLSFGKSGGALVIGDVDGKFEPLPPTELANWPLVEGVWHTVHVTTTISTKIDVAAELDGTSRRDLHVSIPDAGLFDVGVRVGLDHLVSTGVTATTTDIDDVRLESCPP